MAYTSIISQSIGSNSLLQFNGVASGISNGISSFLTQVFLFLPNLIAALVILLVGYLIVRVITKTLGWGMNRANLERHIGQTRLGQAVEKSGHTITQITVSVVKWILLLTVIVYAISALSIAALTASMLGILAWIPNLIGVAIIIFAGLLVGSWIGKGIENILPKYGIGGGRIVGIVVELLIYLFVFNLAIIQLGVGQGIIFVATTALSWGLAAALAIGFGGALLYALKEVLPSMVSGTTTIASTLKPGQTITIEGIGNGSEGPMKGKVTSVGMFNTILERQGDGQAGRGFVILPNNLLAGKPIFVEGGEAPRPFEHGVKDRVSELHEKFENHMDSMSAQSSGQSNQPALQSGSDGKQGKK
jgi:Conserved TM helix